MNREIQLARLGEPFKSWDVLIIGGGATGLGIAVDAALRGYSVALLEGSDFAKGTSSRSTKLVHGGVRYLAKGDIGLVIEALYERGLLMKNAPHLVKNQGFMIPAYRWWEGPFYFIGLSFYDLLAGRRALGRSRFVGRKKVLQMLPTLKRENLSGAVLYHDGQFDDSRLAVNLAQTATEAGACLVNYMEVRDLLKDEAGTIIGVEAVERESGAVYQLKSGCVINATGVFADRIHGMDEPGSRPSMRPSQGIHLVLDKSFLKGQEALMIPKTDDGRVLFAIPWHHYLVVGTTDTPVNNTSMEPRALEEEVSFILENVGKYLSRKPLPGDVQSVFAGLRPLAAPRNGSVKTKEISRRHKISISKTGLLTIIGGKWTTYRRMAKDCLDEAIGAGMIPDRKCITAGYPIHGSAVVEKSDTYLDVYGSDAVCIRELMVSNPALTCLLDPALEFTEAEVRWAVREEMARKVEDVLARRLRALFMDARASIRMAPRVAEIMAEELQKDRNWVLAQIKEYEELAQNYLLS
jgi:glycerol-3-phosphate dehydrogenase